MTTRIVKLVSARVSVFAAVAAATLAISAPADAASFCARLQADYLSAVRSGGGGGGGSRSDYSRLRRELASAEADAKRKNCRGLGIFRKPSPSCPSVMSKLNRIQQQLSQASRGSTSRRSSSDRDRLYSQLRRNGCSIPSLGETASSGYRTLCVRTCDGFYFPVSFSSPRSRFKIDETVCKSMYGGAEAELFVHSNGRAADTAVSLQGTPLSAQSYAFAYRSSFSESCQIELKRGLANLAEVFADQVAASKANRPAVEGTPAPDLLPRPTARINPARDPETQANVAGRFKVAPIEPEDGGEFTVAGIRRLGPDYYYIAPTTIDALYEAPDLGPEFSLISSAHAAEPPPKADGPTGSTVVQ